jgi:hypothetical protein
VLSLLLSSVGRPARVLREAKQRPKEGHAEWVLDPNRGVWWNQLMTDPDQLSGLRLPEPHASTGVDS